MKNESGHIDKEIYELEPGDFIWAKTPNYTKNDTSHMIRPFLILGKTHNKLYCLYSTTNDEFKKNPNFFREKISSYNEKQYNGNHYINCCRIYELDNSDYLKYSYKLHSDKLDKIISLLSKNYVDENKIDYNNLDLTKKEDSICAYKGNYYVINKIKYGKDGYYDLIPLKEMKSDRCVKINNKYYSIDNNKRIKVPTDDKNVHVILTYTNILDRSFNFGDILNLKNGNKVIYITMLSDKIYYCTLSDLEFFYGLNSINKNDILNKSGCISDEDKSVLVKKVDKYLNNNGNFVRESLRKKLSKLK